MSENEDYDELEALARRGRWLAISTVAKSGAGHVGGPFSAMDLLIALYFRVMKVDPQNPRWPRAQALAAAWVALAAMLPFPRWVAAAFLVGAALISTWGISYSPPPQLPSVR